MKLNRVCLCSDGSIETKDLRRIPGQLGEKFVLVECKRCGHIMKIFGADLVIALRASGKMTLDHFLGVFYRDYMDNVKYRNEELYKESTKAHELRDRMRNKKDIF